ncbi:MAG: hypothetical protein K2X66_04420, partial [Cyanobacteria bacterium]|nr:hypothetical protein [Cyanobacteriota bacterium]
MPVNTPGYRNSKKQWITFGAKKQPPLSLPLEPLKTPKQFEISFLNEPGSKQDKTVQVKLKADQVQFSTPLAAQGVWWRGAGGARAGRRG